VKHSATHWAFKACHDYIEDENQDRMAKSLSKITDSRDQLLATCTFLAGTGILMADPEKGLPHLDIDDAADDELNPNDCKILHDIAAIYNAVINEDFDGAKMYWDKMPWEDRAMVMWMACVMMAKAWRGEQIG